MVEVFRDLVMPKLTMKSVDDEGIQRLYDAVFFYHTMTECKAYIGEEIAELIDRKINYEQNHLS